MEGQRLPCRGMLDQEKTASEDWWCSGPKKVTGLMWNCSWALFPGLGVVGQGQGRAGQHRADTVLLLSCVGREPWSSFHAPVFYLCCPGSGAVREAR